MNRKITIVLILMASVLCGCTGSKINTPASESKYSDTSTIHFRGIDVRIDTLLVLSSKHGPSLNLIPAEKKKCLSKKMSVKELVKIVGPGFLSKLSGTGIVSWFFDDDSTIECLYWTDINKTPKWKNIEQAHSSGSPPVVVPGNFTPDASRL